MQDSLRHVLAALVLATLVVANADEPARTDTVYFNAWGGDPAINRYIAWAGERLRRDHGIALVHVKVSDISEAVRRLQAEHTAGRHTDGSMDLLWINGENFATLKRANLLHGPWARDVAGAKRIDWRNPTVVTDGNLTTDGYELPWGSVALTFFYDSVRVAEPPRDPVSLLAWMEDHPGRFTYVQPPAFVGSAFLKQFAILLSPTPERFQLPVGDDFDTVTQPLWQWLDRAHDAMWRRGRLFPLSGPALRELLAVGEVDWHMAYNASEASRAVVSRELPATVRGVHMRGGALANSHFLAIPYNAGAQDAAVRVAAFLLTPEAQARKADESVWGDTTVLDLQQLAPSDRARFGGSSRGPATPPPPQRALSEPHPSWNDALERAWIKRYTR